MQSSKPPQHVVPVRPRKRKWPRLLLALVGLLIVLAGFLPSVLSLPPFRRLILARINAAIPGRAEVGRWSLGWLSGVRVQNLRFEDPDGTTLSIKDLTARPSLSSFLTGRGSLGRTVIDQPKVRPSGDTPFD